MQEFYDKTYVINGWVVEALGRYIACPDTATVDEYATAGTWIDGLPMTGDTLQFGGKTWESLVDYNSWPVPVNWREVADAPYWVQPTGAGDAYSKGFVVTFQGSTYTSDIDANVWAPNVTGWTNNAPPTGAWAAGTSYAIGDQVTYNAVVYRCIQAHTAQVGWEPPNVPALWSVV